MQLTDLIQESFTHFNNFKNNLCSVQNSIPILYFGNYDAYIKSNIKIVTVALNPSKNEFPLKNPTQRFSYTLKNSLVLNDYQKCLNDYFHSDPYNEWFKNGFEKVLEGFGASYYGSKANTVLHTDFCTPIATNPTWSKLGDKKEDSKYLINKKIKKNMMLDGSLLWHKLIEFLQPDVIFACVNKECKIKYPVLHELGVLLDNPSTDSEKSVIYRIIKLNTGKSTLLISGKTRSVPFGSIKDNKKYEVGKRALDEYTKLFIKCNNSI